MAVANDLFVVIAVVYTILCVFLYERMPLPYLSACLFTLLGIMLLLRVRDRVLAGREEKPPRQKLTHNVIASSTVIQTPGHVHDE